MQKSEIILVGEVEKVDKVASLFGYKMGTFLTYIGLPLEVFHNSCVVWDVVEERFKRRLAYWKK